ncbi:MAG: UDP-N-acetylmuramoyl-tripeptide--D-alanyl-D-alanine ligase [Actinobacteria bacterium HGW-Actinobacteria-10]|nr:MAG: UDP-N-acetylmuramoyl-tripeptide--D-alanyl-D-alanine ligase [Actinobacteria bacterium HGW-Actinobacteria-10]
MLTLSVERLLEITGGELLAGSADAMVNGVAIDSRDVSPGNAFVALPGERVDGHDFAPAALEAGARAVVVTRASTELQDVLTDATSRGTSIVRVVDALEAVQALASYHRGRLFCPVIGVTGSTGKTTTKDFLVSVLSRRFKVVATAGNQNNDLGVPLTIFEAGADTDALIVEMAMRGAGQIARLARIASPTVGLITNVGTSHIELLGSQDAIAHAKGELVASVPSNGAVFLNGDDAFSEMIAKTSMAPVTYYGYCGGCTVTAEGVEVDMMSLPSFDLVVGENRAHVRLCVPGRHNVYNALAAAAVAMHLGMSAGEIAVGLEEARAGDMRMQSFETASGITVINDAYNANPTSMRAAVETLAGMTAATKRVAVLGDMAELGSLTELAHFRIGEDVARLGIDVLVTVGERARHIADGARAAGMNDETIRPCAAVAEAGEVLDDVVDPGDVVLVKASRVMGLEAVVEGLVEPRV